MRPQHFQAFIFKWAGVALIEGEDRGAQESKTDGAAVLCLMTRRLCRSFPGDD